METYGLEKLGIINAKAVYRNLTPAQLTEHALCRGEGTLSNTGALVVKTVNTPAAAPTTSSLSILPLSMTTSPGAR